MALRRTALILVIVAIGFAACGGEEEDSGISVEEPIGAPEAPPAYDPDNGGVDAQSSTSRATDAGPSVVKDAAIHMEVVQGRLNSAAQEIVDLATSAKVGGFLVSSIVDTDERYGSGSIVVKVPAPSFERVVGELNAVGKVTRQQLDGQDLTPQYLSNYAALRRARARTISLLRRLDRTEDRAVEFQLREELIVARRELRSFQENESNLDAASSYSTIEVALEGTAPPAPPERPAFERALGTAKDITLAIASGIVLAAGVIVPIGLLLLGLYLVAMPIVRRLKPRLKSDPF